MEQLLILMMATVLPDKGLNINNFMDIIAWVFIKRKTMLITVPN